MTEDEIVSFIASPQYWPHWPVCPVINTTSEKIGLLIEPNPLLGGGKWVVMKGNLFENTRMVEREILGTYDTPEEVVADGWKVD